MKTNIELKPCIKKIIDELMPKATERSCIIESKIPAEASLISDERAFTFILKRLLTLIIQSSLNSQISVSAMYESDSMSIFIKDNNNDYNGYISGKMEKHQALIRRAGCHLSFEFNNRRSIIVILRFLNNKKV